MEIRRASLLLQRESQTSESMADSRAALIGALTALAAFALLLALAFVSLWRHFQHTYKQKSHENRPLLPLAEKSATARNALAEMKPAHLDGSRPRNYKIIPRDPLPTPLMASQQHEFIPRPAHADIPVPLSRGPSTRSRPLSSAHTDVSDLTDVLDELARHYILLAHPLPRHGDGQDHRHSRSPSASLTGRLKGKSLTCFLRRYF